MDPNAANSQNPQPNTPPQASPEEMMKQGKEEIKHVAAPFLNAIKPIFAKLKSATPKPPPLPGPPSLPGTPQVPPLPHAPMKKGKLVGIVLGGLVILFIVGFLTMASIATYTKTKLPISEQDRKALLFMLYQVPLFPKTPEQILLVAIDKNANVVTAAPDFSFSAIVDATNVKLANLDLVIKGKLDLSPEKKLGMDLKIDASASLGENAFDISGQLRKKEDTVYYKIDKLPDYVLGYLTPTSYSSYGTEISDAEKKEIRAKQQKVFENWIKYEESEGLDTEARKKAEEDNKTFISDMQKDSQEFLLKTNTLPEVTREADETIDGTSTYHLKLKPSKKLIKRILVDYAVSKADKSTYVTNPRDDFGALADSIQSVEINMWIGKNDTILRKLAMKADISLTSLQESLGGDSANPLPLQLFGVANAEKAVNPKLTISTVSIINAVNEPVTIDVPKTVLTSEAYTAKLTEASKTKSQRATDQKLGIFKKDAFTIRYLLSKYYIQNGKYPEKLVDVTQVTNAEDPIIKQLGKYQYKIDPTASKYIVFSEFSSDITSFTYYTPYYGFTSTSQDVHQLLKYEFDTVNNINPSPTPLPRY